MEKVYLLGARGMEVVPGLCAVREMKFVAGLAPAVEIQNSLRAGNTSGGRRSQAPIPVTECFPDLEAASQVGTHPPSGANEARDSATTGVREATKFLAFSAHEESARP